MNLMTAVTSRNGLPHFGVLTILLMVLTAVWQPANARALTNDEATRIATDAYIYGYPLVTVENDTPGGDQHH
jgi:hypothetical protein